MFKTTALKTEKEKGKEGGGRRRGRGRGRGIEGGGERERKRERESKFGIMDVRIRQNGWAQWLKPVIQLLGMQSWEDRS
jgi:hypothetical protein